MKNLLVSLAICLIASNLFPQDNVPVVKTIEGVSYFCYTRAQAETLAVKLSDAKYAARELEAANEYISSLELSVKYRNELMAQNDDVISVYKEQIKDYKTLVEDKNPWWNKRFVWAGTGALVMYMAVKVAVNIK